MHDNPTFICKAETAVEDKQIVWGAVYVPDKVDSQGDYMVAEEIETMAYEFMKKGRLDKIDLNHNNRLTGAYIVESYISKEGDLLFPIVGTWVVAVHIPDAELWEAIKNGEINGFSMEAAVRRKIGEVAVPGVPYFLTGDTETAKDGHYHTFEAIFDENGVLTSGRTNVFKDPETGEEHFHIIRKPVVTEKSSEHAHRFLVVKEMVLSNGG